MAGFVVPFMAVYDPALMMQGDSWVATLYMLVKAILAVVLWGMASIGHFSGTMPWWERVLAFAAGLLLILALPISDEAGFALGTAVIGWHLWRHRAASGQPA
ncbi:hypothetical protein D3C78_1485190 [compost metagenome]